MCMYTCLSVPTQLLAAFLSQVKQAQPNAGRLWGHTWGLTVQPCVQGRFTTCIPHPWAPSLATAPELLILSPHAIAMQGPWHPDATDPHFPRAELTISLLPPATRWFPLTLSTLSLQLSTRKPRPQIFYRWNNNGFFANETGRDFSPFSRDGQKTSQELSWNLGRGFPPPLQGTGDSEATWIPALKVSDRGDKWHNPAVPWSHGKGPQHPCAGREAGKDWWLRCAATLSPGLVPACTFPHRSQSVAGKCQRPQAKSLLKRPQISLQPEERTQPDKTSLYW